MTKFTAFYNLFPISDTKEFLGLSPDYDSSNIIATIGRNICVVIKISTQKQIRSWSVLEKFSCKVTYDHKSQQYVGVFANRYLRLWDETVSDINKCKKLKFHKNIADLMYSPDEVLVVYLDGSCESLSSAVQSRKEQLGDNLQLEAMNTNAMIDPSLMFMNGRIFFTYFQKDTAGVLELIKRELGSADLKPVGNTQKCCLRRSGQDVLAGYSVIESENSLALLSIWNDGRVFLLNLVGDVESRTSPGQFVSIFTDLKVDMPLTILGLSKHCVAIYGANSTQEGGSLLLYNTQFKVVKAKQFFKIYFNYSRLWSVGSSILLAMGQNLSVVSYQMSKELLSDLVGSQISNNFNNTVEIEFLNEEEELEDNLSLAEVQKPYSGRSNFAPRGKLASSVFADGKTVPFECADEFNRELNRMMNRNVHVELVQDDSVYGEGEISLMSNYYDTGFVTEEVQIIAKQLEQCGASEHEITEKLLWVLLRADLIEDIAVCLRRYTSISEKMLVKTLKYVLQDFQFSVDTETKNVQNCCLENGDHMDVDIIDSTKDKKDYLYVDVLTETSEYSMKPVKERKGLMNVVLSCTFDVPTISAYIHQEINYGEALKMLEYLYVLITSKEPCLEERLDCPDQIDDDLRILRWLGVFLDTHFQKMSLSKDLHLCDILLKWHDVFNDFKKQILELESIAAVLYNIVDKKQLNKESIHSKWYSIEEVHLY